MDEMMENQPSFDHYLDKIKRVGVGFLKYP
jgi:hypothetical protein